ncbi:MAG: hypothetical protein AAGE94_12710 [Acidobacteriota bacterium]
MMSILQRSRPRVVVLATLVLFLVALVVAWSADLYSRAKVRQVLDEHAADGPFDFADHIPPKLPPGVANGTDYLEAAALLMDGQDLTYPPPEGSPDAELVSLVVRFGELDAARVRPTGSDVATFRHLVERFDLPLTILDRGFERATDARYRTNYDSPPFEIFIPNVVNRVRMAHLLRARGEVAIADGRAGDAWGDAARIVRIAHWTSREMSMVVNQLIARSVAEQADHLIRSLLAEAPAEAVIRRQVHDELERLDPAAQLARALDTERAVAWSSLRDPRIDAASMVPMINGKTSRFHQALAGWRPWVRWNAARYLEVVTPQYERCKADDDAETGAWHTELRWVPLARAQLGSCSDLVRKARAWRVALDQAALAEALEVARTREGSYPEQLGELAAGFTDPFSGKSYGYARDGSGYRLWSVGTDREDDGGRPHSPAPSPLISGPDDGDLVWRVIPPDGATGAVVDG